MSERAWDQGYEVGYDDAIFDQRGLSTDSDADQYPHDNPYRNRTNPDIDVVALRARAIEQQAQCDKQTAIDPVVTGVWLRSRFHPVMDPAVVLELLDRLTAAEEKVSILEQVRADEWDADAPMPETATPEWGTEDYRRHAVLFNDITYCRIHRRLNFSDRLRLQRHLWALGWRRDVQDEDVTEGDER